MRRLLRLASFLVVVAPLPAFAQAQQHANKIISTSGTVGFIGLGLLLPLIQDRDQGLAHSARTLDSLLVSGGLAIGMQDLTHVDKPDNHFRRDAFPSTHATLAFSLATMQSQFHPSEAPLWYAGASLIALSRVQLHEHTWAEVGAGAVLGFTTARIELSNHRGLLLYPIMNEDGGFGAELSMKF